MIHKKPAYVKRNTLISAILLLPFIIGLTIASVFPHALNGTAMGNPWRPLLFIAVYGFPFLAAILMIGTTVRLAFQKHTLSFKNSWSTFVIGSLAILVALFLVL